MNETQFMTLTDQDLMEIDGGFVQIPLAIWGMWFGAAGAGAAIGAQIGLNRKNREESCKCKK